MVVVEIQAETPEAPEIAPSTALRTANPRLPFLPGILALSQTRAQAPQHSEHQSLSHRRDRYNTIPLTSL
jgi:hypothetical protein